tara:strand:- start:212 stop:538 length:327 start_codon:yes stop_codon:yes gene_type:complete
MSKGNAPTAAQIRWREAVRTLDEASAPYLEIHHPVGATGKHNKQKIGHWWVCAVDEQSHKDIHAGVFGADRKLIEKRLFDVSYTLLLEQGFPDMPPPLVYDAIMGYHR